MRMSNGSCPEESSVRSAEWRPVKREPISRYNKSGRVHAEESILPIYEFYCSRCHTIFNFYSRAVNTTKRPPCPRCKAPRLERKVSSFAISRGQSPPEGEGAPDLPGLSNMPNLDDARVEQAMAELAREAEGAREDDPRQMAQLMRKLYDATGMKLGSGMEEAVRRMEAGEDPEKIEEEMGDLLEGEDPFLAEGGGKAGRLTRKLKPPSVDETLYEL